MYKIFNTDALAKNSRFIRGFLAGSVTTIILIVIYGFVSSLTVIELSLAFIGIGYLIGQSILKFGKGVKIEFAILGAVLTTICIIFSDFINIYGFESIFDFSNYGYYFTIYLRYMLSGDINSLLSLAFRAVGIYNGYYYSRIV